MDMILVHATFKVFFGFAACVELRFHLLSHIPFLFFALPSPSPLCFAAAVASSCYKYNQVFFIDLQRGQF